MADRNITRTVTETDTLPCAHDGCGCESHIAHVIVEWLSKDGDFGTGPHSTSGFNPGIQGLHVAAHRYERGLFYGRRVILLMDCTSGHRWRLEIYDDHFGDGPSNVCIDKIWDEER